MLKKIDDIDIQKLQKKDELTVSDKNSLKDYYSHLINRMTNDNENISRIDNNSFDDAIVEISQEKELDISLELLLKTSVEGFILMNSNLEIVRTNPAFCHILERPQNNVIGKSLFDFVDEQNFNELIMQKAIRKRGKKSSYKVNFMRSATKAITCKLNESPIFDKNKKVIGSFALISNYDLINKMNKELEKRVRKRTVQLQNSLKSTKKIIEEIPIGVIISNNKKIILSANSTAKKIFELESMELEGRICKNIICKNRKVCPVWDENKTFSNFETIIEGSKGRKLSVLMTTIPMVLNDENVILETYMDISELKETQKSMLQSEKKYREIFEKFQDIFFRIDLKGVIKVISPSIKNILGISPEDVIDKSINDLPIDSKFINRLIRIVKSKSKIQDYEIELNNIDNVAIMCSINAHTILNSNNEPSAIEGVIRDISLRKKTEVALKDAMKTADEANQAKSDFLANMSHEIRTPMNAILGFTKILENTISNKVHKSYLDSINVSGKNLMKIINDILDLSKIEARRMDIEIGAVNSYTYFKDFEKVFKLRIEKKGIIFIVEIDENLPQTIFIDEVRVRQIIFNLLSNAIKFTSSGFIKLDIRMKDKKTNKIDLAISVTDSGIGIPKQAQSKIFESFTQQDGQRTKKYGGTGLGLTISLQLIKLMNGSLTVESEVKKGSKFEIILPDIEFDSTIANEQIAEVKFTFENQKVLIVDKNSLDRFLIKEILNISKLNFVEVDNYHDAFEFLKNQDIDIIVQNVSIHDENKFQLVKALKTDLTLQLLPIIGLTASVQDKDIEEIYRNGFDSVLKKPFSNKELISEIGKYLEHSLHETIQDESPLKIAIEIFSLNNKNSLKEINSYFENTIIPNFEIAIESMRMASIIDFSKALKQFSKDKNLEFLETLLEDLEASIIGFDFEKIELQKDALISIVQLLKKYEEN